MVKVVVVAPVASERAVLRALAHGPGLDVVGVQSDLEEIPTGVDVLLVSGGTFIARAFDRAASDGGLGVVGVVRGARAAAALVPDSDVPGWALLDVEATAREVHAAVHAAAAGLGSWPASWTDHILQGRPRREPFELTDLNAGVGDDYDTDLGSEVDHDATDIIDPLTSRERQVLELLAQGLSNRLMADRLTISEHTVKFHVASIYGKLGVSGRAAAVRRAFRQGLISV